MRAIDWNVTARMGQPFVKRFVEERELTVLFVVDASGSLTVGTRRQPKREVVAELAALLAFAAVHNNDRVGLDPLHRPRRAGRAAAQGRPPRPTAAARHPVLSSRRAAAPASRTALDALNRVQRKRAIVFLFSDFLDTGFDRALRLAGRRHDLIAVWVRDPLEEELPDVGPAGTDDAETGEQIVDRHRLVRGSAGVRGRTAAAG